MALAVIFLIDLHFNFLLDWNKKSRSKASAFFSLAHRSDKRQVLTILENLRSLYGASCGSTFPRLMPLVPGIAPTNLPFIFRDPKDSEKSQMGPTGISASPQKASASRPSGRFPRPVAMTPSRPREAGVTQAHLLATSHPRPHPIPAPGEPTPSPSLPRQESASPSPKLTRRQSCLPPPTEAPQPTAG